MNSKVALALCGTILISSVGCTTTMLQSSKSVLTAPISFVRQGSDKRISKVLGLWEPSEGQGLDGTTSRGFAGQVMFFSFGKPSPVKVTGTVKVYLYEDYDPEQKDRQPKHVFTFVEDGWDAHRSEGTLGQSYNVFLPAGETSASRTYGLRVEHTDRNGRVTRSPFTKVSLAEKTSSASASAIRRDIVRRAETRTRIDDRRSQKLNPDGTDRKPARQSLDTMTISLPQR